MYFLTLQCNLYAFYNLLKTLLLMDLMKNFREKTLFFRKKGQFSRKIDINQKLKKCVFFAEKCSDWVFYGFLTEIKCYDDKGQQKNPETRLKISVPDVFFKVL